MIDIRNLIAHLQGIEDGAIIRRRERDADIRALLDSYDGTDTVEANQLLSLVAANNLPDQKMHRELKILLTDALGELRA